MMVAADTGGAIKGDIRADFFWGSGANAKENAGKMAEKGKLTLLLPKDKWTILENIKYNLIRVKPQKYKKEN